MKISQENVILIKNLYLSKQCGARRLARTGLETLKHRQSAKENRKIGTIVQLPRQQQTMFSA